MQLLTRLAPIYSPLIQKSLTHDLISQLSSTSQSSSISPSPLQPQATLPSMPVQHTTSSIDGSNIMNSPTFNGSTIKSEPMSTNQCMYTQGSASSLQSPFNQTKSEFGSPSQGRSSLPIQSNAFNQQTSHVGQTMDYDFLHTDIDLDDIFYTDEPEDPTTSSQLTSVPTTPTHQQQQLQTLPSTSCNTVLYSNNSVDSSFTSLSAPTLTQSPSTQPFVQQPHTNRSSNISSLQPQQTFNGGVGI